VALLAGGGLMCLLAVTFPFSPVAPNKLIAITGLVDLAAAAALWTVRRRVTDAAMEVLVVVAVVMISVVVALAKTYAGALATAFPLVWLALYVALFFPRRTAFAHASFIIAAFGVGLAIGGLPHMLTGWLIVSTTVAVAALALGSVSAQLRRQALTDPLTGLLNRAGLAQAAEREIALADRTGLPLTVVAIDLDDFKAVNDREGHSVGDGLLADAATAWRTGLRKADVVARSGGDEFVLLLPATDTDAADQMLARLRDATPVAWSAGVASWRTSETFDECLVRADRALYRAKATRALRADPLQRLLSTSRAARSPERTAPSM
jgi:diguanylate cyclase (GGDEF)-like protein